MLVVMDSMLKPPQDWCNLLIAMEKALIQLITDQYPQGFRWNENGIPFAQFTSEAKPAEEKPAEDPVKAPSRGSAMNSLKAELERMAAARNADGSLKLNHVDKSQMSHKNPALRGNVKMVEKKETYCFLELDKS